MTAAPKFTKQAAQIARIERMGRLGRSKDARQQRRFLRVNVAFCQTEARRNIAYNVSQGRDVLTSAQWFAHARQCARIARFGP